ncbi:uncharacterized protein LOC121376822 [Gigantopelta aegis]|uniref:uncharacterized protein LOC121376822 n=1 Tax=Gigantopelta aegis TaxID=1735272 RepID=UPI001B88D251|nr:uncharacterized protein LOC121376822 [Gigantopelta aegis]
MYVYENGGEHYTMREFYDEHQKHLPKLIVVTQGYDGGVDLDTMGMGQVMRVHSACTQTRVVAKDGTGRTITIPVDYPLPFRVCKQTNKTERGTLLSDVLADHVLPVEVEFACPRDYMFDVGYSQASAKSFGKITLSSLYDETYCIANCIYDGVLEPQTVLIPLYLQKVLVSTVVGIKGRTREQFLQFLHDTEQAAKGIIHVGKTGNENIAMYKKVDVDKSKSENVYETFEPEKFFRFAKSEEYCTLQTQTPTGEATHMMPGTEQETRPPELPPRYKETEGAFKTSSLLKPDYYCTVGDVKPKVPQRTSLRLPQQTSSGDTNKVKVNYVNDIGRAVVSPYGVGSSPQREAQTREKRVEELTIDELGDKLKALKLDRHVESFRDERIDGCLLTEFDQSVLRDEFKFTQLETIKLMKFIRTGHVPR